MSQPIYIMFTWHRSKIESRSVTINKSDIHYPGTDGTIRDNVAFEGFRKCSSRLKEAAPLAASLYNHLSGDQKQIDLYRMLTGEIITMLKTEMDKENIYETLLKKHVEPRLLHPENYPVTKRKMIPKIPASRRLVNEQTNSTSEYLGRLKGQHRIKRWKVNSSK